MVKKGGHLSAATRAKISAAKKGRPHPHTGHPQTAATRAKISSSLTGKAHHHKGHPESAATRAKISASLKGKHHSAGQHSSYHPGSVQRRGSVLHRSGG